METSSETTPRRRGRRAAASEEKQQESTGAASAGDQEQKQEAEKPARRTRRAAAMDYVPPAETGIDKDGNKHVTADEETLEYGLELFIEIERLRAARLAPQEQVKAINLEISSNKRKFKALGIRKEAVEFALLRRRLTAEERAALDLEYTIAARAAKVPLQPDLFGTTDSAESAEQSAASATIQ